MLHADIEALSQVVLDRGLPCEGCAEKSDFLAAIRTSLGCA